MHILIVAEAETEALGCTGFWSSLMTRRSIRHSIGFTDPEGADNCSQKLLCAVATEM